MPHYRLTALLTGAFVLLAGSAGSATGAVAHRSTTCGQGTATALTLSKPAGTAAGDVLVASIGTAKANAVPSAPSGWTLVPGLLGQVNNDQRLATFYKVSGGSEPASYTFTNGTSIDATAGGIAAFTGVDNASPIAGTPAQSISSSVTDDDVLPNSNGTAAGSMRYSAVTMDDAGNQWFSPGMTLGCNEVNSAGSDASTATGWEPTGAGTTATRTVFRDDNGRSILQTLVLNPACGAGGLVLMPPDEIAFGSAALTGEDAEIIASSSFRVDDQTGSQAGWSVSATTTTFTNGTHTLPNDATRLIGVIPASLPGRCSAPVNAITYPVALPAGTSAPPAVKIYNAAIGSGAGPTDLGMGFGLAIPANARIGTYSSTWTVTLSSGP